MPMDASIDLVRRPAPAGDAAAYDSIETPGAPARARLATAIHDLAIAAAALAAAQQPVVRLGRVIAEATRCEAELAARRAADQDRLGAWLLGGGAPRPAPDPATIAAERRCAELAGDVIAARAALPAAEAAFRQCAERVRDAQRRRDEAVCDAAVDAARHRTAAYRAALTRALEEEAVLHGLRDELAARANRPDAMPGAANAAARIGDLIAATKRGAGVRHNPHAGRRLLDALLSDADASL
jgi:hypothetical protein